MPEQSMGLEVAGLNRVGGKLPEVVGSSQLGSTLRGSVIPPSQRCTSTTLHRREVQISGRLVSPSVSWLHFPHEITDQEFHSH